MLDKQSKLEKGRMTCRAGRCSFWIDWQGNIGNCGMYLQSKKSLVEQDFETAWKKVVDETENTKVSSICINCPNNQLCHSCIAMIYNESGDFDGYPNYLCEMNMAAKKYYKKYVDEKLN